MSILHRKLLRDARRRRAQFIAIVVTIFIGITLFGASYDAFRNLTSSYEKLYRDTNFADAVLSGGDRDAVAAAARNVAGVAAVESRVVAETPLRTGGTHKLLGRVISLPDLGQPAVNSLMLLEGESPAAADRSQPVVLIEQHMASHFDLGPGDTLEVLTVDGWQEVPIAGVVASPEYLWPARSRQEIFPPSDEFGVLFARRDVFATLAPQWETDQVAVLYHPEADPAAVEAELRAVASAFEVDGFTVQEEQPSNAGLQEDVKGFGELSLLFPILFLGSAGMAVSVLLTRLVLSQRAHIGLLLAAGYRRRAVFTHYLQLGLGAGIAGAIPGALAGSIVARAITGLYTSAISVPVRVVEFRLSTIAGGIVFGLVAGTLASLGPAIRAARISPAQAMRGTVPPGRGRPSLLERALPPLGALSARSKLILRGVGRSPGRSISTMIGVVLAAILILASWGMVDTTQVLLSRQFDEVQLQDAQVYVNGAVDDATLAALAAIPGVDRVEPAAQVPVVLRRGAQSYETSLLAFPSDTTMHAFEGGLPPSGLLAGSALTKVLGVEVGDEITIIEPSTGLSLRQRLVGLVDEPLGTFAYASLPALDSLGRPQSALANSALLAFAEGADRQLIRTEATELATVVAYVDSQALDELVASFMGLFYAFVGVMIVFGGIMAFALIFNAMSANIAERSAELAALRAAGVPHTTISGLITRENVLLTVLGIVPGVVIGHQFARLFMASFSSDLFQFDAVIRPQTYVYTGLAILAAALLSQWPVLRNVERIDVARVVRERSL